MQYFLVFSARRPSLKPFSIGGHAFISWGRGQRDSTVHIYHTYGFYPSHKNKVYQNVTEENLGEVLAGYKKNSIGKRLRQLIVQVDSMTWVGTQNQAEGWTGNGYNLLYKNCDDFIDYIAETAGLISPRTTNFLWWPRNPVNYIKCLWRKNRKNAVKISTLKIDIEGVSPNADLLGPDGPFQLRQ